MADLNCSIKAAIAYLLKDRSGRWWTHTQQSLEARYREARSRARDAMRDRLAQLLVQQAALSPSLKPPTNLNSSRTLMETSMNRTLEKHGLTIYEACIFSSLGKTKLYEAIKSGELKARKAGKSIRVIAREQGVGIGTVARLTG